MTPKWIGLALVAALVAVSPLAAAEENATKDNSTEPDDGGNAWVEDCPPDRMCAASSNESSEDPRECMDCPVSHTPSDNESNCMDGQQEGEFCRDDVHYMTPPSDGREPYTGPELEAAPISAPADESGDTTAQEAAQDGRNNVPALGLVGVFGMLGALAAVIARRP